MQQYAYCELSYTLINNYVIICSLTHIYSTVKLLLINASRVLVSDSRIKFCVFQGSC